MKWTLSELSADHPPKLDSKLVFEGSFGSHISVSSDKLYLLSEQGDNRHCPWLISHCQQLIQPTIC